MSQLHRFIAASGMTNLADGIALVAWDWIASLLTRDALLVALTLPFWVAGGGGGAAVACGLAGDCAGLCGLVSRLRADFR